MKHVISLDLGSSSVRASVVNSDLKIISTWTKALPIERPAPNFVQYNGETILCLTESVLNAAINSSNDISALAITNQRATTAVWHRDTGKTLGPVISWMDLRTAAICLGLREKNISIAPNQSASKLSFLLSLANDENAENYCFGTLDTFLIWHLTKGQSHLTDHSNAATTGIVQDTTLTWSKEILKTLAIPTQVLPEIAPSCSYFGDAIIGDKSIPILGAIGDQQASLLGQGCSKRGQAKITFGTGTILDQNRGFVAPESTRKGKNGTFPIVAYSTNEIISWATEAIALGSGAMLQWLINSNILKELVDANEINSDFRNNSSVYVVPANLGLGTPEWDFGARSVISGLDLSTTSIDIVAATLDGIAQLGSDLLIATEADTNLSISKLHIDGGMTDNSAFLQLAADAIGIPLLVASVREATTLGASILAFAQLESKDYMNFNLGIDLVRYTLNPRIERDSPIWRTRRERWLEAKHLSLASIPELTNVVF